jgi:hypothetical protein
MCNTVLILGGHVKVVIKIRTLKKCYTYLTCASLHSEDMYLDVLRVEEAQVRYV